MDCEKFAGTNFPFCGNIVPEFREMFREIGSLLWANDQDFEEHPDQECRSNFEEGTLLFLFHWTSLISYKIARKVKKWTSSGNERKENGCLIQYITTLVVMYHCLT